MDTEKIGHFIAQTRKDCGMTQRELAEKLNISDKAVSKWERGVSLPDISVMVSLCEELRININELLSGERLSKDSYDRKAEENMMNLMEENKTQREKLWWNVIGTLIGLLAVFAMIGYTVIVSAGFNNFYLYELIDIPSLLMDLIALAIILGAAGLMKDFFRGFQIAFKGRGKLTNAELDRALIAQKYAIRILLLTGPLTVLVQLSVILHQLSSPDALGSPIAIAIISLLYAFALAIILSFVELRIRLVKNN
ncbi:MAG: helix-turn-helix transcriptional regulator [Lachnospiraceae bacterium]|nr:helix-turn-helix transcriptional regulator [Lachnospiraceae bacterium]